MSVEVKAQTVVIESHRYVLLEEDDWKALLEELASLRLSSRAKGKALKDAVKELGR